MVATWPRVLDPVPVSPRGPFCTPPENPQTQAGCGCPCLVFPFPAVLGEPMFFRPFPALAVPECPVFIPRACLQGPSRFRTAVHTSSVWDLLLQGAQAQGVVSQVSVGTAKLELVTCGQREEVLSSAGRRQ